MINERKPRNKRNFNEKEHESSKLQTIIKSCFQTSRSTVGDLKRIKESEMHFAKSANFISKERTSLNSIQIW